MMGILVSLVSSSDAFIGGFVVQVQVGHQGYGSSWSAPEHCYGDHHQIRQQLDADDA